MTGVADVALANVQSISALALAGLSAFAVAIRWAMTHTHSARILSLEQKAADHDTQIATAITKIDNIAPKAISQVAPVVTAIDPKIDAQIAAQKAKLDELSKIIADATAKLNAVTAAMPKA